MDVRRKTVARGEPLEQLPERIDFRSVERSEEVTAVGRRRSSDVAKQRLPIGGQVDGVVTPVVRVAPSFEQAVALELVDEPDESTGHDPQLVGESLLGPAGPGCDESQESGLRGADSERGDAFCEPAGRECTDLGQQKRDLTGAATLAPRLRVVHCPHDTWYVPFTV